MVAWLLGGEESVPYIKQKKTRGQLHALTYFRKARMVLAARIIATMPSFFEGSIHSVGFFFLKMTIEIAAILL